MKESITSAQFTSQRAVNMLKETLGSITGNDTPGLGMIEDGKLDKNNPLAAFAQMDPSAGNVLNQSIQPEGQDNSGVQGFGNKGVVV